jgi:hypothetical protein
MAPAPLPPSSRRHFRGECANAMTIDLIDGFFRIQEIAEYISGLS